MKFERGLQPLDQPHDVAAGLLAQRLRQIVPGDARGAGSQNRRADDVAKPGCSFGPGCADRGPPIGALAGRHARGPQLRLGFVQALDDPLRIGHVGQDAGIGRAGRAGGGQQRLAVEVALEQLIDVMKITERWKIAAQETGDEVPQLEIDGHELDVHGQVRARRQQIFFLPEHGADLFEFKRADLLDPLRTSPSPRPPAAIRSSSARWTRA